MTTNQRDDLGEWLMQLLIRHGMEGKEVAYRDAMDAEYNTYFAAAKSNGEMLVTYKTAEIVSYIITDKGMQRIKKLEETLNDR